MYASNSDIQPFDFTMTPDEMGSLFLAAWGGESMENIRKAVEHNAGPLSTTWVYFDTDGGEKVMKTPEEMEANIAMLLRRLVRG